MDKSGWLLSSGNFDFFISFFVPIKSKVLLWKITPHTWQPYFWLIPTFHPMQWWDSDIVMAYIKEGNKIRLFCSLFYTTITFTSLLFFHFLSFSFLFFFPFSSFFLFPNLPSKFFPVFIFFLQKFTPQNIFFSQAAPAPRSQEHPAPAPQPCIYLSLYVHICRLYVTIHSNDATVLPFPLTTNWQQHDYNLTSTWLQHDYYLTTTWIPPD